MSITAELINEKIKDFERDLKQVLEEQKKARDSCIESERSCLEVKRLTINAIADAYIRIENTIRNEIRVLKKSFNDEMIKDINHIFDQDDNNISKSDIRLIISVRADIVKFEESGISANDYNRDMKAIRNKIDDVSKFNPGIRLHTMDIPVHKNEAIKSLVMGLKRELKGYVKNLPIIPISDNVIKDIITVISDRKHIVKGQNAFNQKMIEEIKGLIEKN